AGRTGHRRPAPPQGIPGRTHRGGVVRAPRGVRGEDGSHDGGADRTPDSCCPATCRSGLTAIPPPRWRRYPCPDPEITGCGHESTVCRTRGRPYVLGSHSNNSEGFMTPITFQAARSAAAKKPAKSLGPLPEWNLADLYPAMDAPEVKRDLDRGETECIEFEKAYKGRLADIAASPDAGRTLGEAVRRYEAIEDVLGRLISYAGLLYAGNTTDPAIAK